MAVDLSLDDRRVLDKEIEFADLIEDVDYAAQVHLEAQRGEHGVMFDLFDVAEDWVDDEDAAPGVLD